MKMMRAKERYKVNNVITIIRVNFMQRRTHFTFLNSFFPPSIYNRIQKMLLFCQSEMRKRGATALQCPYSYTFSSIHPSKSFTLQPPTFYLYLHSSPKQKKICIYIEENMNEHFHDERMKKSFRKLFFLCSELWLSRFTLINADDGDETLTTTETMILMMIRQWQFLFST